MRVVIRSQGVPVGDNVDNRRIQVHVSYRSPSTSRSSRVASSLEDKHQWRLVSPVRFYTDLRRFMGSQFERKKVQRKPQVPKCEHVVGCHWGVNTAK